MDDDRTVVAVHYADLKEVPGLVGAEKHSGVVVLFPHVNGVAIGMQDTWAADPKLTCQPERRDASAITACHPR